MNLLQPVERFSWTEYRQNLLDEQGGSCDWLERVARGQEALHWKVPASLELKVHPSGRLLPFHGDTVVFPLDFAGLEGCARMQAELTRGLEDLFAEPLYIGDLHLTLHDLSNGPSAPPLQPDLQANAEGCRRIFLEIRSALEDHPELAEIHMRPVRLFDCLNISVLAGYAPATERDHRVLQNLYSAFDEVRRLNYWLRPHVTLAYFRPRVPTLAEVRELVRRFQALEPGPDLRLPVLDLAYQHFEDMNRYLTRFTVRTVQ